MQIGNRSIYDLANLMIMSGSSLPLSVKEEISKQVEEDVLSYPATSSSLRGREIAIFSVPMVILLMGSPLPLVGILGFFSAGPDSPFFYIPIGFFTVLLSVCAYLVLVRVLFASLDVWRFKLKGSSTNFSPSKMALIKWYDFAISIPVGIVIAFLSLG